MSETETGTEKLRVLLADDHALILEMVSMFAAQTRDLDVTTAETLDAALKIVDERGTFDIVLLDLDMPGMNGLSGIEIMLEKNERKPVAIFTGAPSQQTVEQIMHLGAAGVLLKTTTLKSLANAISFMAKGERYLPLELWNSSSHPHANEEGLLTERELQVLEQLSKGLSNRAIAEILSLAEPTVKTHVNAVCRKLEAQNRTHAVIKAQSLKLI